LRVYKFTGKERDTETGNDYFGARFYASNLGRFLSADEFTGGPVDALSPNDPLPLGSLPYANIANPQSLNKYTYVYNNPLRYVDPWGHAAEGEGIKPDTPNATKDDMGGRRAAITPTARDAASLASRRKTGRRTSRKPSTTPS
jgi:RHS repeat-associated protein